jgi:hypothetical protein
MSCASVVKFSMSVKRIVSTCFSAPGLSSLEVRENFPTSLGER